MYKYFFILFLLLFHVFSCQRSEKVDSFELFQKRVSGDVFHGLPKFTNKEIASCFGLMVKYPTKLESKSNIASLYIVFDYNEVLFNYELRKLKENNIAVFEDSYN